MNENSLSKILREQQIDESRGLNRSDLNFKYQLIKGRIAENIVQELFLSHDYQVFKHGIENNYPYLVQKIQRIPLPESQVLRAAPDLIIYDDKKSIFFAEVKFCGQEYYEYNSKLNPEDYSRCFPNAIFFIVTPKGIFHSDIEWFIKSKRLSLSAVNHITMCDRFKLDRKVIEQFEQISAELLAGIKSKI